jgi:FdhD protein
MIMFEEDLTKKSRIIKVDLKKNLTEQVEDEIAVEERIKLYVNGRLYTVFSCSPKKVKELIVGRLLTDGKIRGPDEIAELKTSSGKAYVKLVKGKMPRPPDASVSRKDEMLKAKQYASRLNPKIILRSIEALNHKALIYKRTGGTHAAALFDKKGKMLVFSEDIGRHNAVDKVLGEASLMGIHYANVLLASTGRPTSEIVSKAAQVGVQVIVSVSAPTDKGVKIAEEKGLTLIGFVRGSRLNIYTNLERVEGISQS